MYLGIPTQRSCARAWVAAASAIASDVEAYNVVIDVEDPVTHDKRDNEVFKLVDSFLKARDQNLIATVVNTIFPQALYQQHGSPKFYEVYHDRVYTALTQSKRWGRYFERMTRKIDRDGTPYNPLQRLIEKLRRQNGAKRPFKAAYELPIYDSALDRKRLRNAPCLSFLSFKRHPNRGLVLTAVYRNQMYITRCLGNLIGLGLLQAFAAKEAGLDVGPLTCISTHAELDTGKGWGITDARKLIESASDLLNA